MQTTAGANGDNQDQSSQSKQWRQMQWTIDGKDQRDWVYCQHETAAAPCDSSPKGKSEIGVNRSPILKLEFRALRRQPEQNMDQQK